MVTNNALGWGKYAVGMYMSSKKPIVTDSHVKRWFPALQMKTYA